MLRYPLLLTVLVAAIGAGAGTATAAPLWSMLQVAHGGDVDADTAASFRDLLQAELSSRTDARLVRSQVRCKDAGCARQAAVSTGTDGAVYCYLSTLGDKVVGNVSWIAAVGEEPPVVVRVKAASIAGLHEAAGEGAEGLIRGIRGGAVGTGTQAPPPPVRRQPDPLDHVVEQRHDGDAVRRDHVDVPRHKPSITAGPGFWIGASMPMNDVFATTAGFLIDLSLWMDGGSFAFEPRMSLRTDVEIKEPGLDDDQDWIDIGFGLGGYFLPLQGDFTPYIGAGVGLHYVHSELTREIETGSLITTKGFGHLEAQGWATGLNGKAGVMFRSGRRSRISIGIEYQVVMIDLNDRGAPQTLNISLGTSL